MESDRFMLHSLSYSCAVRCRRSFKLSLVVSVVFCCGAADERYTKLVKCASTSTSSATSCLLATVAGRTCSVVYIVPMAQLSRSTS